MLALAITELFPGCDCLPIYLRSHGLSCFFLTIHVCMQVDKGMLVDTADLESKLVMHETGVVNHAMWRNLLLQHLFIVLLKRWPLCRRYFRYVTVIIF